MKLEIISGENVQEVYVSNILDLKEKIKNILIGLGTKKAEFKLSGEVELLTLNKSLPCLFC